uniref:Uncharacterized protein LOC107431933 isoform X1 n=1 Tax=Rhizophora mucronata TaxID=61149 RepID=A0A2P2L6Y6_RHIMU
MSLYIGNLSSRIRGHELERVFQRFGRCNVRLKDGYGFVVYDFPPNAEKALRALQNRNICGLPLTLTWSNKQPRPGNRFARANRANEPQRDWDSVRGGDYMRKKLADLEDQPDNRMNFKQPDINGRRLSPAEMHDEEAIFQPDVAKEITGKDRHDFREDFLDDIGTVERDRWGEQSSDLPDENGVKDGVEFDRYEPTTSYYEKNDDENHQVLYSGGSIQRKSAEDTGRDNLTEKNPHQSKTAKHRGLCYRCGGSGHKIRNCPEKNPSLKNLSMIGCRIDDTIDRSKHEGKPERYRSRSREKLRSSRDVSSTRRLKHEIKLGSRRHRRSMSNGSSPVAKETDRSWRKDYGGNKRSRKEIHPRKEHSTMKARSSFSSPLHFDKIASKLRSTSRSSKRAQRSRSHTRSKSVSPRVHSISSDSKSSSASHYSRSRSPTSLSLSVSFGQPLPPSSKKGQLNLKGSLDNPSTLVSKEDLIEQEEPANGDSYLEVAKLEDNMVIVNNDVAVAYSEEETKMEEHELLQKDNYKYKIPSRPLNEGPSPSTLEAVKAVSSGNFFPESSMTETGYPDSDVLMMEPMTPPTKMPELEAYGSSYSSNSTSISSDELSMVFKHYGLDLQDENENHLPAEAYFGSARLWPWHIIYYRRLKKGPVTIENYAKRVEQNKEFHIVDKYIRSSSGWGGPGQENP